MSNDKTNNKPQDKSPSKIKSFFSGLGDKLGIGQKKPDDRALGTLKKSDLDKLLKDYRSAVQDLQEAIGEVRGYDHWADDKGTGGLSTLVGQAENAVSAARTLVDQPGTTVDALQARRDELKKHRTEFLQAAEARRKQVQKDYKATRDAIPAYLERYTALRNLRGRVEALPLANAKLLQTIDGLLERYKPEGRDGSPAGGVQAALEALKDALPGLLKQVNELELASKEAPLPDTDLLELHKQLQNQLASIAPYVEAGELRMLRGEVEQAMAIARDQRSTKLKFKDTLSSRDLQPEQHGKAVEQATELTRLQQRLTDLETTRRAEVKAIDRNIVAAVNQYKVLAAAVGQLTLESTALKDAVQARQEELEQLTQELVTLRQSRQFAQAARQASQALDTLRDAADSSLNVAALQLWTQTQRPALVECERRATPYIAVPALSQQATTVSALARSVVKEKDTQLRFGSAAESVTRVQQLLDALEQAAQERGVPGETLAKAPTQQALRTLRAAIAKADREVGDKLTALAKAFKLNGELPPTAEVVQQRAALMLEWTRRNGDWSQGGTLDPERTIPELTRFGVDTVHKLDALAKRIDTLLEQAGKPGAPDEVQRLQQQVEDKQRHDRLLLLGAQLRADAATCVQLGVTLPQDAAVVPTVVLGAPGDDLTQALELVEQRLRSVGELLEKRRGELLAQVKFAQSELKDLDKQVGKIGLFTRTAAPGFVESFKQRTRDADAMLQSGDPVLIAEARADIARLQKVIDGARGKGNGKSLEEVVAYWNMLSDKLGRKQRVKEQLRATYMKLSMQLRDAIELAQSSDPDEGYAALAKLAQPIDDACGLAKIEEAKRKNLEALIDEAVAAAGKLVGKTGFSFRKKPDDWLESIAKRGARIKAAAAEEGAIEEGQRQAAELKQDIEALAKLPREDARTALYEANGQVKAAKRELIDLCKAWARTTGYWDEQLLPSIEAELERRNDSDNVDFKDLKGAVKRAGDPLKAYLDLISALPHKRGLAEDLPDMDAARKAFTAARKNLAALESWARRLFFSSDTTNIEVDEDLVAVGLEWSTRARRFQVAIDSVISEFGTLRSTRASDPGDTQNYLPDEQFDLLKTATTEAVELLRHLRGRFSPEAFHTSLGVLAGRDVADAQRLKAREDALRVMRRLRGELNDSPALKFFTRRDARALVQTDLVAAMGLLLASLKKIELNALGAA